MWIKRMRNWLFWKTRSVELTVEIYPPDKIVVNALNGAAIISVKSPKSFSGGIKLVAGDTLTISGEPC